MKYSMIFFKVGRKNEKFEFFIILLSCFDF